MYIKNNETYESKYIGKKDLQTVNQVTVNVVVEDDEDYDEFVQALYKSKEKLYIFNMPKGYDVVCRDDCDKENLKSLLCGANLKNVKIVSDSAFNSFKRLEKVKFSNKLEYIEDSAFSYCGLKELHINAHCDILRSAFRDNEQLEEVKLSNVRNVALYAFADCHSLKKVKFVNVESASMTAFYGDTALTKIELENSNVFAEDVKINNDGKWEIIDARLIQLLGQLNEESLLALVASCPKLCLAIPSERCDESLLLKVSDAVVAGMAAEAQKEKFNVNVVKGQTKLLEVLKIWKKAEFEKHKDQKQVLEDAFKDFKDEKSK